MPNLNGTWTTGEIADLNSFASNHNIAGGLVGRECPVCHSGIWELVDRPGAIPRHNILNLAVGAEQISTATVRCDNCTAIYQFDASLMGVL